MCDDHWNDGRDPDSVNADVVCQQLGYDRGVSIHAFGGGLGPIWLDNVECVGDEESLLGCPRSGDPAVGVHNCGHAEDVGVTCLFEGECIDDEQCDVEGEVCISGLCASASACGDVAPFASLVNQTTFDGSYEGIVDLGPVEFPESTDFTFVGRVNARDLRNFGRIFDFGPDDENNFRFHQNGSGTGRVAVGRFNHVLTVEDYWELDVWLSVVVKFTASTNQLSLYKDGVLFDTLENVTIPEGFRENLLIGGSNWSGVPSPETPSIMTTRWFQVYFDDLNLECTNSLLDVDIR